MDGVTTSRPPEPVRRWLVVLGGSQPASTGAPAAADAARHRAAILDRPANIVDVVGESYRQDALDLELLGGGRGPEGVLTSGHLAGPPP